MIADRACSSSSQGSSPCDADDDNALFALSGLKAQDPPLTPPALEKKIAAALQLAAENVSVVDVDDGIVQFVVYRAEGAEHAQDDPEDEDGELDVVAKLNQFIESGGNGKTGTTAEWAADWLNLEEAECSLADMEVDEFITEQDALEIWRNMPEDARTSHLEAVASPDGMLRKPAHDAIAPPDDAIAATAAEEASAAAAAAERGENLDERAAAGSEKKKYASPTERHLQRDSSLLDFDNVPRVAHDQLSSVNWTQPVVITGLLERKNHETVDAKLLSKERLLEKFGNVEVRTGNRDTLVEHGFTNSLPMTLGEAIGESALPSEGGERPESSRMVFSPVRELPGDFQDYLEGFTSAFPEEPDSQPGVGPGFSSPTCHGENVFSMQFTLTLANDGFGIGMHKHGPAMFLLVQGRKKWYMAPPSFVCKSGDDSPTHPGFYREKSSHKCILHPGELLYVPNDWYHEIFNLEYTAGIQALP